MRTKAYTLKVGVAYFAIASALLLIAYVFPGQDESVSSVPVLASLLLLVPLYAWFRMRGGKRELSKDIIAANKSEALFWVFALFLLAMLIRIPSVLIFGVPFEKTPVIFLTISAIVLIEKTDPATFGFTTRKLGKSLLYGVIFYITLNILATVTSYLLVYGLMGGIAFESFNPIAFLSVLPFMTLCVAICEEGLFRGYIQTHLGKFFTVRGAIVAQAILFGVWHFVWNLSPFDPFNMAQYILTTFYIGLFFGYFYSKTRNLAPLIFAHGLWNSVSLGIVENQSAFEALTKTSALAQLLVFVLPQAVAALITCVFIHYFVKKVESD